MFKDRTRRFVHQVCIAEPVCIPQHTRSLSLFSVRDSTSTEILCVEQVGNVSTNGICVYIYTYMYVYMHMHSPSIFVFDYSIHHYF